VRPDPHAGEVPVVYVEPAAGAVLTGEEVLDWARQHIGERAAVPKEAIVIERSCAVPAGEPARSATTIPASNVTFIPALAISPWTRQPLRQRRRRGRVWRRF
jgi:fatty-acyl-CoA synthase